MPNRTDHVHTKPSTPSTKDDRAGWLMAGMNLSCAPARIQDRLWPALLDAEDGEAASKIAEGATADDGTAWDDDEGCYYSRPSQRQSADTLWVLAQILLMGLVCAGAWALTVRIVECLS